jgi:hypothetical protein
VKYQVQVKVSDGEQWSDWSNIGWMIVNSPPAVTITSPDGQSKDAPTMIFDNLRPVIGWVQSDPDWNRWNKFYMEILDVYGNRVYDTGWTARQDTSSPTNAFQIPVDLPTLVPLQARMRVTDDDDNLWSDWSNTVWFFLDRTPAAEVIVPNGTQVNPTPMSPTPTIQFNEWDPDPGNVFTKYQVRFISENGGTVYHDSGEVSQNVVGQWGGGLSYAIPEDRPLPAGAKVQVRVRVYDGYIWSAWSASTWLVTNRPPVADFDWTPKPVWEGDAVTLLNHSVDPDGDALTSFWRIQRPDGSVVTGTNWNMASVFELAGDYTVTLTVSDGKADASTTRVIRAQELTIRSEVNHTAAWLVHHQKRGHNVTTPPKDFYSGEIFVVETNSSPAPVSWARAWIDTTGLDGQRLQVETMLAAAGSPTHFAGELFDERFLSMTKGLPKGRMEIHFQICYANGVIRQESVPVNIIGNANASFTVHRRQ